MKKCLVLLVVFGCLAALFPSSATATIGSSPVQTAATGGGKTATFASNTTAGNAIIVLTGSNTGDVTNVADDNGNSYTEIVKNDTAARFCSIWFAVNITGGATTAVTITTTDTDGDSHVVIAEWDTTANDFEVDQSNTADSSAVTNHPKGDITTAHDDTLVVGVYRDTTSFTVGSRESGYAVIDTTTRVDAIYQVYSSTVTTDGDMTTTAGRTAGNAIASLNEIVGAGGLSIPVAMNSYHQRHQAVV